MDDVRDYGVLFKRARQFSEFFHESRPSSYGSAIKDHKIREHTDKLVKRILSIDFQRDYTKEAQSVEPEFIYPVSEFCQNLESVVGNKASLESAVDDLGKTILRIVGFNQSRNFRIEGPVSLSFPTHRGTVHANPDIAVVDKQDRGKIVLLVQEDKRFNPSMDDKTNATAQLIAEAVAAFSHNNNILDGKLEKQVLYGIVMLGTHFTFYRIFMTKTFYDNFRKCNSSPLLVDSFSPGNFSNDNVDYMIRSADNIKLIFDSFERLHSLVLKDDNIVEED